jgi:hypothetical protein
MLRHLLGAVCLVAGTFLSPWSAAAAEPGWTGVVFARGETKEKIEATPILERNYRPLHFYGNTVRRQYYRGTVLPAPRDFVNGAAALMIKR